MHASDTDKKRKEMNDHIGNRMFQDNALTRMFLLLQFDSLLLPAGSTEFLEFTEIRFVALVNPHGRGARVAL
jgi:hypothetical protein